MWCFTGSGAATPSQSVIGPASRRFQKTRISARMSAVMHGSPLLVPGHDPGSAIQLRRYCVQ